VASGAALVTARTWLPRYLHPGAWWLWAIALAVAASRTTNPLLLGLLIAVAGFVVAARRPDAPWARSYGFFLLLGLGAIVVRIVLQVLFVTALPGHELFRLPEIALPNWAAGVQIGGPVTVESLALAFYQGAQLATMLACIGAANALASPGRLLRALPTALYEVGVAVTVAMTFAPQTVIAVVRLRAARRLRGHPDRGLRSWRGLAIPVLQGALDRSIDLAAAMDSRGFGRRRHLTARARGLSAAATIVGLLAVLIGLYALLDPSSPSALGLPLLLCGTALSAAGVAFGSLRGGRTRYRPDPWSLPEWLVVASGAMAAIAMVAGGRFDPGALSPFSIPLSPPPLPLLPVLGALVALLPAWVAPPLPRPRAASSTPVPSPAGATR
jgi:energy-coupling factor transport system permease protein